MNRFSETSKHKSNFCFTTPNYLTIPTVVEIILPSQQLHAPPSFSKTFMLAANSKTALREIMLSLHGASGIPGDLVGQGSWRRKMLKQIVALDTRLNDAAMLPHGSLTIPILLADCATTENENENVCDLCLVLKKSSPVAGFCRFTQGLPIKQANPSPSLQRQRFGDLVLLPGALPMILFPHCQSVALEVKQTNNLATGQKG